MVLFYTFPFLDANDFDEVGYKDSLQVCGNIGDLPLCVKDEASLPCFDAFSPLKLHWKCGNADFSRSPNFQVSLAQSWTGRAPTEGS